MLFQIDFNFANANMSQVRIRLTISVDS